jgi:putative oxidoreductase
MKRIKLVRGCIGPDVAACDTIAAFCGCAFAPVQEHQTDRRYEMANSPCNVTALIGRILLSLVFIISGIMKVAGFSMMTGFVASKGLPLPAVSLACAAIVEILGGLALLLGFQTRIAAWVLFIYLIPTTLAFHNFWAFQGMERMDNQAHFLKNLAIMGGLLLAAAFGPGGCSLDAARQK